MKTLLFIIICLFFASVYLLYQMIKPKVNHEEIKNHVNGILHFANQIQQENDKGIEK